MTRNEILCRFPKASEAFINANLHEENNSRRLPPSPEPEQIVCHEPLEKMQGKEGHTPRFFIRIESRRVRLIDPDNLCPKYFIDAAKYEKLIPDDTAADLRFEISQVKVADRKQECTIVEIVEKL